jgi:FkbM family methyltransferase
VIDVVANIGFFTVVFADQVGPARFVHAFEPLAANSDLLVRSIAENGFDDRVLVGAAVGDSLGEGHLVALSTSCSGGSHLVAAGSKPPPGHAVERPTGERDRFGVSLAT